MTRILFAAAFVAIAIGLAGCSSAPVREPPAPLAEFDAAFQVRRAWSAGVGAKTRDYVGLVPAIRNGTVYAAGPRGRVIALALDTGDRRWETDLKQSISGAIGVGEALVAVGTRRGEVVALSRADGKTLWRASVSSEVLAPPAVGAGVVVVQSVDGRATAFSAESGRQLWVYERPEPALSLRGTGVPVIVSDGVLVGFASGRLVALQLEDGRPFWEATVSQPRGRNEIERLVDVDAPPLVFPDAIYAASYQGKLVALSPRTGNTIWSRDVSTYTGLASDGVNIYLTNEAGHVLAFDRRTGASAWKQEALRGRRLSPPAVYGDFVAVADFEGYVHWLAREDGRFAARHRVDSAPVRVAPAVAGDTLVVSAISGEVAALRVVAK